MEVGACRRGSMFSSYERLAAIGFVVLAVASPLYIDRQPECDLEDDEQPINVAVWLPLLLCLLILGIALSASLDQSLTGFDRYWIHRVCGSSGGIVVILTVLFLILQCKSSL
ncbi:putative transmembrane protein [Sesbania bispinosa]|nr:putative transmembrane protein [Sesbania bispinosa]